MDTREFSEKAVDALRYTLRSAPAQVAPAPTVDLYFGTKIYRLSVAILSMCKNGLVGAAEIVMRSLIEHWIEMLNIQLEGDEGARRFLARAPVEQVDWIGRARKAPVGEQGAEFDEAESFSTRAVENNAAQLEIDPAELSARRSGFVPTAMTVADSEADPEGVHVLVQAWLHYCKTAHPTSLDAGWYLVGKQPSRANTDEEGDHDRRSRNLLSGVGILNLEAAKRLNERLKAGAEPQLRDVRQYVQLMVEEFTPGHDDATEAPSSSEFPIRNLPRDRE